MIDDLIKLLPEWNGLEALERLGAAASIAAVMIIPAYRWLRPRIANFVKMRTIPNINGIYRTEIADLNAGLNDANPSLLIISDIVRIRRRWVRGGFKVNPVYIHDNETEYEVTLRPKAEGLYYGDWEHVKTKSYRGSAMIHKNGNGFTGYMLGSTHKNESSALSWKLQATPIDHAKYFTAPTRFKRHTSAIIQHTISLMNSTQRQNTPLSRIFDAHHNTPDDVYKYDDMVFRIDEGVCNPKHSTFSETLLRKTINECPAPKSVLDLGTGCGLFSIVLKERGVETVVALDFAHILNNARYNASKILGPDHGIQFEDANPTSLFTPIKRKEKFDVIIANLPFAPQRLNLGYRNSKYFNSFTSSSKLMFNLVVGCKQHLTPGGSCYFVFGPTGDEQELQTLIRFSGLESKTLHSFKSDFSKRRYTVYQLSNIQTKDGTSAAES